MLETLRQIFLNLQLCVRILKWYFCELLGYDLVFLTLSTISVLKHQQFPATCIYQFYCVFNIGGFLPLSVFSSAAERVANQRLYKVLRDFQKIIAPKGLGIHI